MAPAVQMKMAVSKPGDKHEQEADRMADKVMRMPSPGKEEKLQRSPDEKLQKKGEEKLQKAAAPEEKVQKKEDEKLQKAEEKVQKKEEEKLQKAPVSEEKLQRKGSADAPSVNANLQSAIQSTIGGGQPLSSDVRSYMESRFNADFSKVRIHSDPQAAALSNQIGAKAFTYRNNIFFSLNQYQPGTSAGKQLLAHELTHTIQQGHAVWRKAGSPVSIPKSQASAPASKKGTASSGVVDLSTNIFQPSQTVKDEIEAQGINGLDVRVKVKGLTGEGRVKIKSDNRKYYNSIGKGSMPLLNAWGDQIGGMHINFKVTNGEVKGGYASLTPGGGTENDWLQAIKKNSSLLGGLGLNIGNLPTSINKFDNGKLTFGVTNLKVEVGGFVSTLFNISVENTNKPKIDATGYINVKGVAKGQLKLDNTQEKLTGQVSLAVDYKSFSGQAEVTYNPDGTVDIAGKAAYNANNLSGEIQFVATDLNSANNFAKDAIAAAGGKENVQNAAAPASVPAPKANQKQLALAATGQLAFNLTTWFAGTVNVVVDGKGEITVIGKIAPPAEVELFRQRDWENQLVKFEAKAYYGIPLVGNLNLFANISLFALAKLGPAKMYNIEILGTYSTDPNIQKNIQIAGSINISAYAGLRLRAEGGAGVEIVEHNVKFGIGLDADVGVKAYVDTRPTIGYRDPGIFYISGTLEMVAQPMLGLGGDFFIQLESPWWSPAPNEKWIWPLFSKEWPMADPIGLSAVLKEYVLGSGVAPEIEMKKPEFDPSKFMTSMVDKTLPDKTGGPGAGQGRFKEDGSVSKPEVKSKNTASKEAEKKVEKKGIPSKGGKSDKSDKNATIDQDANKTLKSSLEGLKKKAPYSQAELDKALGAIQGKVKGVTFNVQEKGDKWSVTPVSGGKKKSSGKIELAKANGAVTAWWKMKVPVNSEGASHSLYYTGDENSAELMVASNPKRLENFLADARKNTLILSDSLKEKALTSIEAQVPILRKARVDLRLLKDAPEDQRQPYIDTLESILGKIGAELAIVLKDSTQGVKSNAIHINWPKPAYSDYPKLYLYYLASHWKISAKSNLGTVVAVYHPDGGHIINTQVIVPPAELGSELGIKGSSFQIDVNKVIGPLKDSSTPGGGKINSLLERYGWNASDENMDGDHVQEIQFGGEDKLANLWPLNASMNRGAGSILSKQQVELDNQKITIDWLKKVKKKDEENDTKYFFKIDSVK